MVAATEVVVDAAIEVVVVAPKPKEEPKPKAEHKPKAVPDIEEPSIRISLLASGPGAPCTSDLGRGHTFVLSLHPAPGRMFSLSDLLNETGTNSAFKLIPLTKN